MNSTFLHYRLLDCFKQNLPGQSVADSSVAKLRFLQDVTRTDTGHVTRPCQQRFRNLDVPFRRFRHQLHVTNERPRLVVSRMTRRLFFVRTRHLFYNGTVIIISTCSAELFDAIFITQSLVFYAFTRLLLLLLFGSSPLCR